MDEEFENDRHIRRAAIITAAVAAAYFVAKIRNKLERRRKLRKIQEWKTENLAVLEVVRKRLMDLSHDPSTTSDQYFAVMQDEKAFLNMMLNRPMY